jgi:hypothetical protein
MPSWVPLPLPLLAPPAVLLILVFRGSELLMASGAVDFPECPRRRRSRWIGAALLCLRWWSAVITGLLLGGGRSRRVEGRERGPGLLEQLEGAVGSGRAILIGVQNEAQLPLPALDVLARYHASDIGTEAEDGVQVGSTGA